MKTKITYKGGYPTAKCIKSLLEEFNISGIKQMDSYKYNHSISWGSGASNSDMLSFVDTLSENGIKIAEFKEYVSPISGSITFAKMDNPKK